MNTLAQVPPNWPLNTRQPGRLVPAGHAAPHTQESLCDDRLNLLLEVLARVTDPRSRRGRVHPLPFVLALAILAVTAGAKSSLEIAERSADLDPGVLRILGWRRWSGIPSRWTFDRVLAGIDDTELDQALSRWATPATARAVAVDGKTMRAAATGQPSMPLTQVVAATGADGRVLGQARVVGGNENAAALDLIARLGPERLSKAVLTADAKHTGARFVAAAEMVGAFWLLPIKHNGPALRRKLAAMPWGQVRFGTRSSQDAHGRRETRTLKVLALGQDESAGLLGAAQAIRVHRYRRRTGRRASRRTVYFLTSLLPQAADPIDLAELIRGHWGIENKLHHVRDTAFDEDRHRARTGNLAAVHAVLRNTALTLHRAAGAKQMKAALRAAGRHLGRVLEVLPVPR